MGDEYENVSIGTLADGHFAPLGHVSDEQACLSVGDAHPIAPGAAKTSCKFNIDLTHIDRDALHDLFGIDADRLPEQPTCAVLFETRRTVLRQLRHRYVWQYRRERKGCRRRGPRTGRLVTMTARYFIRKARVVMQAEGGAE